MNTLEIHQVLKQIGNLWYIASITGFANRVIWLGYATAAISCGDTGTREKALRLRENI